MSLIKELLKACGIPPKGIDMLNRGYSIAELKGIDQKMLDAMYSLGHQNYEAEKFEEARNMMRYLSVHDHRNTDYLAALGACEFRLGNYPAAISVLEAAWQQNPNDAGIALNLGLSLAKAKQRQAAKTMIQKAEALAKDDNAHKREWLLSQRILQGSGKRSSKGSE